MHIDQLTGLRNRRALETDLQKEIARARRYQFPLSAIMINLDQFREVSDSYGHKIGDEVLQKVAEILRQTVREVDCIYRYGDEKFVVLTPHISCVDGITLAERIRKRLERHIFTVRRRGYRLTIKASLGISELDIRDTPATLLIRANRALYRCKTSEGNKIVALCTIDSGPMDTKNLCSKNSSDA